jgi:HD-like signal output (HDOD) protein
MSDDSNIKEQRLGKIRNYISRMPSLSTTVTKVLEVCNSPQSSANDLNRVISLDPVLTGKVLTVINSAYYSLLKKVSSLTRAVVMLGVNTVRNLALGAAVLENLSGKESFQALSVDDFWSHSICVGVTAKLLAVCKGVSVLDQEEYFVAGLLHDLGKIPLNSCLPDEYGRALDLARREQRSLHRAEHVMFGLDHCMVGKMIADKWQLGETMNDSLLYHHDTAQSKPEARRVTSIVALANEYANSLGIGSSGDLFCEGGRMTYLLEEVGVSWSTLANLNDTVLQEIEKAAVFLKIS